ncbi:hypothetical protein AGMMS49525_07290 [Bacteroidia bacterium]|nr:hypothetical protein AGMMS49525_07290 [Bacteroidia bacterium]
MKKGKARRLTKYEGLNFNNCKKNSSYRMKESRKKSEDTCPQNGRAAHESYAGGQKSPREMAANGS